MFKATFHALALTAALAAVPAHAALTPTGVACDGHSTGMILQPGYVDCAGSFSGNNSNQVADVTAEIQLDFGATGSFLATDVTGSNSGSSGTLTFATLSQPFVLALKAGDAFSLYLYSGAGGVSSINFDTLGVGFFSGNHNQNEHFGQGLSHATIYTGPGLVINPVGAVPEPETYALMAAGLAFVGWASRRRQRKQ